MTASTAKVRLQFLRSALRWAAGQRLIPECPRFPDVKVPKKKPSPIPLESVERVLEKAPDTEWRIFLLCGWLAGLRLGETMQLEWEPTTAGPYLDFARQRIVLPAEFVKGVEDQWIPLDPALEEVLEGLPRKGRKVFPLLGKNGTRMTKVTVAGRVARIAKKAGVRLTMKTLRKGFGCRYAGKVPAQVLQKLMRHANITTTMDYYANVDAAVEEAVLGPQRNRSRNRRANHGTSANNTLDANAGDTSISG